MVLMLKIAIAVLVVVEIALLILSAACLHWWIPVAESLIAAFLGLCVIGYALEHYREAAFARLDSDVCLDDRLANGPWLLLAGVLLLVPGMLTDLVGVALLVAPLRHAAIRAVRQEDRCFLGSLSSRPKLPDA
jgi:UPF0716 protein FxsA